MRQPASPPARQPPPQPASRSLRRPLPNLAVEFNERPIRNRIMGVAGRVPAVRRGLAWRLSGLDRR